MKFIFIDEIRWFNVGAWYALSLMEGLRVAGHDVNFIGKGTLPPVEKARERGFHTESDFNFTNSGIIGDSSKLAGKIVDFKPDAIVAMRGLGQSVALAARRRSGVSVPVIRARIDARDPRTGQLSKRLFSEVLDGVITPSEKVREQHMDELGMEPKRVMSLPGGVDTDEFSPEVSGYGIREKLGIKDDDFLIGSIGRLDFVKGHEHFLKVASLVKSSMKNARFIITGDEVNVKREELVLTARGLGLEKVCHIIADRMSMPEVMFALDLVAISSVGSEALSRVALEAFASGKPVVSTNVGVLDELVDEGVNGHIVPPENPPAMAGAIIKLMKTDGKAQEMGKAARAKAVKELSRKVITGRFTEFVKTLGEIRREVSDEKEQ